MGDTTSSDRDTSSMRPLLDYSMDPSSPFASAYSRWRRQTRRLLATKTKHYVILSFVTLDVAAILADIFINLVSCDLKLQDEPWVEQTGEALYLVGVVFSSLFLGELVVTIWAYGFSFFQEWFHCFDAFVILASFIIDVLTRGILEEIGSLVIILRLWRLVKIVEELSVGASERMEEIEAKVVELERENEGLRLQMEDMRDEGLRY
ncbi:ion transporter [Bombardia bombarda]|uniref:Voltage-gated hydrogen channel 1 n=1 Tax=Bombardia bombarda TaxID=252184 RepID=A0AA39WGK9_9PEZI|nr:ion transporter [Bombardia bombarda]